MLNWLEAFPLEVIRLFACDGPMNGGGGGGGGGKTTVELTSLASVGEALPLLLMVALFLAAGVWMFRRWGGATVMDHEAPAPAAKIATDAGLKPSAAF